LGQLLITTGAIVWTNDCTKALTAIQGGNKSALKHLKKKQVNYLSKLTDLVRTNLGKVDRSKSVASITMEIHNRDVMERIIKKVELRCGKHPADFWVKRGTALLLSTAA